jgi:hypothetical protein
LTAPAVTIAERIWPAWRERSAEEAEWQLLLLFVPAADGAGAERALLESVREIAEAFEAEAARSGDPDPPFVGEWSTARIPAGVAVHVTECDVFDRVLPDLAAALARRGLAGTIDLWEPPPAVRPPTRAPMLACHIRIRGERVHREDSWYTWAADRDAWVALVAAAEGWSRGRSPFVASSLRIGTAGTFALAADEDVLERIEDAVERATPATLNTLDGDSFRCMHVGVTGALALVIGGGVVDRGQWREPLAALVGFLRDQADHIAYAYVRRGWAVATTLVGAPLLEDWPRRPDEHPGGAGSTKVAFEDLYAPDAFGVQLLGPRYTERVPTDLDGWRLEPVRGSTLVEHVDADAWFDCAFVPFGQFTVEPAPAPELLRAARADLAPVLYTRGVLAKHGFADMGDL